MTEDLKHKDPEETVERKRTVQGELGDRVQAKTPKTTVLRKLANQNVRNLEVDKIENPSHFGS